MSRSSFQDPTRSHAPVTLANNLEKRLLTYTAAVSAAGVGLLSTALPAEAKVVYTPSNIPIVTLTQLDLNKDGTPDFTFNAYSYQTHGNGIEYLKVSPDQPTDEILGVASRGKFAAAALPPGYRVGPKRPFKSDLNGLYMAKVEFGTSRRTYYGPWLFVETAYLGLKFAINGEVHYGWARIKFAAPGFFQTASIAGYAYETVANKAVVTGVKKGTAQEPGTAAPDAKTSATSGTLGLLGRGAVGLATWRKTGGAEGQQ